ncbi:hypothetical protein D3C77_523080 [compost metagenome]
MLFTTAKRSALTRNWLCNPAGPFSIPSPIPAATYCPWALSSIFTAHIVRALPSASAWASLMTCTAADVWPIDASSVSVFLTFAASREALTFTSSEKAAIDFHCWIAPARSPSAVSSR